MWDMGEGNFQREREQEYLESKGKHVWSLGCLFEEGS